SQGWSAGRVARRSVVPVTTPSRQTESMTPQPSTSRNRSAVDELEHLFIALADKTRLRILALLGKNEVCVCHIHDSLGLPQPTVSRHLAYLARSRSGPVAAA